MIIPQGSSSTGKIKKVRKPHNSAPACELYLCYQGVIRDNGCAVSGTYSPSRLSQILRHSTGCRIIVNHPNTFQLPVADDRASRRQITAWLVLAIGAMAVSTMFAFVLVFARTPGLQALLTGENTFQTALVAHVDFAVLIWLLSCAGLFWSLICKRSFLVWDTLALILATLGAMLAAVAPLGTTAPVVMSNYVPVLTDPLFITGLALFTIGVSLKALRVVIQSVRRDDSPLQMGVLTAAVATLVAVGTLLWALVSLPEGLSPLAYYEGLFWGAGHVLQFTHSALLLVTWIWLLAASGSVVSTKSRLISFLFLSGMLPLSVVPLLLSSLTGVEGAYWQSFTWLMQYGLLFSVIPIAGVIVWGLVRRNNDDHTPAVVKLSMCLLGLGLVLGSLIRADNLMVTAHYHGTNAAVTLAFMGLIYHLLPRLGFRDPTVWKMVKFQPYIYATGMGLYIFGMAWSGWLELPRKTSGAAQGLDTTSEHVAMSLMGLGGLVAIVGSAIFVIYCLRSLWPQREEKRVADGEKTT